MSTQTERFFSRKSSGRYGQGIRLNQVNRMDASLGWVPLRAPGVYNTLRGGGGFCLAPYFQPSLSAMAFRTNGGAASAPFLDDFIDVQGPEPGGRPLRSSRVDLGDLAVERLDPGPDLALVAQLADLRELGFHLAQQLQGR